jgi:HAE1 family hydrophobic/amphiphilic exporter-1
MYAQFALVIAATALISAINAATLKPTQCALWLRRPVPMDKRNFFYRGFNYLYQKLENAYVGLIRHMTRHSLLMVLIALIAVGVGGWGIARIPTSFIPLEDQGYVIVALTLPDGASLERTQRALAEASKISLATPGVDQSVEIAGISVLDNSATLANGAAEYVILKDWGARLKEKGQDLRSIVTHIQRELDKLTDAVGLVIVPPAIQGIGNSGGFTMMVEIKDNTVDFPKLQNVTDSVVEAANSQSSLQRVGTTFRAAVPQLQVLVDRPRPRRCRSRSATSSTRCRPISARPM